MTIPYRQYSAALLLSQASEQPTKYELVINLKTAKALGLECLRRYLPAPTR